ncbi:MAG: ThuA domain-containing protein [Roseburia sp.]|nr:ThuA domain-containing protein [Roseburia sp.]
MIRVTVWNEYKHEREYEDIRQIYPQGIHGCIAAFLGKEEDFSVRTAVFDMPEHGLTQEVLEQTDVLIIWSHALQEEFSETVAERVRSHVLSGMGLIALHSAHYSKIMKKLLGTSMTLKWRHGEREKLWCMAPVHPIARGIPEVIELPQEEMYGEYFDIPRPDDVIFGGWFSGGELFRSGCTFTRGYGKIFYFQPGHEEYPIYHMPEIQQVIVNAVRFCAPASAERKILDCEEVKQ